tara:strand:- start:76490 stop:77926 length:1437 start_codon:yes stop_codon:yes gene_type:complete
MPREINNFESFNEANIRNNRGLSQEYIDGIKRDEQREAHRKLQSREVEHPSRIMPMVEEIMRIQGGRLVMTQEGFYPEWNDMDKKENIEQLAVSIIEDRYGRLLDVLNIEMDIKLVDPNELEEMKQGDDMEDGDGGEPPVPPEYEETNDSSFRDDVDKRKIANIITQGSAKNVHRLIHLYKDTIEDFDVRLFELMDKLIKSNEVMEWMVPEEQPGNGAMIRQMMNGFSQTEFDPPEAEQEAQERAENIDAEEVLEEGNYDEVEQEFEDWDSKITVKARAIDLVVLLHECVKGIFEVLGYGSLPQHDEQRATDIMANTDTLNDEFEDLRYGPRIRQDLLNWFNSNEKSNELEDGFEYFWADMMNINSNDFLNLFYDIVVGKTGSSDRWLNTYLDGKIEEVRKLQQDQYEYDQKKNSWENQQKEREQSKPQSQSKPQQDVSSDGEPDYSKMNQKELGEIRDNALDSGDFDILKVISKYLD